jgi:hypothetical protein
MTTGINRLKENFVGSRVKIVKSNGIRICVTFLLVLVVIVVTNGCATASDASKAPRIVVAKSRQALGTRNFVLLWVPISDSPVANAAYLTLSSISPSDNAYKIARLLSMAQTNSLSVAVSGGNSRIARQDIMTALSLQESQLTGLRLAFIGDVADRDAVRAAVEQCGGKFYFEPFDAQSNQ